MDKKEKPDNNNIGNAGEYFIASILSSRGYVTTITLGRAEAYDIISIRPDGKTIKIQVKTAWHDNHVFRLSEKDGNEERNLDYFYAFVTLKENKKLWEYYIVPAKIVAKSVRETHKFWLNSLGKNGQKHNDTKMRLFEAKPSKWAPEWFTQELIDSFKNNIDALEKD
jgi:PD-(D/E)XK endonuclease